MKISTIHKRDKHDIDKKSSNGKRGVMKKSKAATNENEANICSFSRARYESEEESPQNTLSPTAYKSS